MRRALVVVALVALVATPARADYDFDCGTSGGLALQACHWDEEPGRLYKMTGSMAGPLLRPGEFGAEWSSPAAKVPIGGAHLTVSYELRSVPANAPRTLRVEARWLAGKRWSAWLPARVPAGDVGFGLSAPARASWTAKVPRGTAVAWQWRLVVGVTDVHELAVAAAVTHRTG